MPRLVALLRGVNLGRNRRLSMADLRRIVEGLGYGGVETYLQSGNVLFAGTAKDARAHERRIEKGILDELGMTTTVLVRTGAEMRAIVKANPFAAQAEKDPTKVHVAFLSEQAPKSKFDSVDQEAFAPDEVAVGPRALYLHHPNGFAGSRMKVDWAKTLGVDATSRNWRTVENLTRLSND